LTDTNRPRDALRHTQSSSCCAQSWTLRVIDRQWSMCRCEIILRSEVAEKLQRELHLCTYGDIWIS